MPWPRKQGPEWRVDMAIGKVDGYAFEMLDSGPHFADGPCVLWGAHRPTGKSISGVVYPTGRAGLAWARENAVTKAYLAMLQLRA